MSVNNNRPVSPSLEPVRTTRSGSAPPAPKAPPAPPSKLERSQSFSGQSSVKDPVEDLPRIESEIDKSSGQSLRERSRSMPKLSSVDTPEHSTEMSSQQRKSVLSGLVSRVSDVEKSLRSTFFKTRKQRQGLLDQAAQSIKAGLLSSDDKEALLKSLKSAKPLVVKDELAKIVGSLRPDKYGSNSSYSNLSSNKKALVDSIYKSLMQETVDVSGDLDLPQDLDTTPRQVGLPGTLKQDFTLGEKTYKKGEPVVFHERDGKTFVQLMTKNEDGTKGSFDEYKVLEDWHEIDAGMVKVKPRQEVKLEGPLFDGPVSVSDIRQGAIGDCYLIAGIYSLARQNPQAIHDMMKDNGDGSVTVRLYEKNQDTDKYEPVYITVDKSVPKDDKHAEDTPWVQMLEKAYAVHKGSYTAIGKGGHTHDVFSTFLGVDSEQKTILGGIPKLSDVVLRMPGYELSGSAMKMLQARKDEFGFTDEQLEAMKDMPIDTLKDLFKAKGTMIEELSGVKWPQLTKPDDDLRKALASDDPQVKAGAMGEYRKAKDRFKEMQTELDKILTTQDRNDALQKIIASTPTFKKLESSPTVYREDVEQIITEMKAYAEKHPSITQNGRPFTSLDLIEDFETHSRELGFPRKDVSSKLGTEIHYNVQQVELFESIKEDLSAGKYLAVGSEKHIGVSQGKGHSGGESIVDGLAGQHAYSLLDTFETGDGRKFVRIANPWGSDFSRDYTFKDGQLVSKKFDSKDYDYQSDLGTQTRGGIGVNESWVELRELTTLFRSYYATE